jgi:hypothetical protein
VHSALAADRRDGFTHELLLARRSRPVTTTLTFPLEPELDQPTDSLGAAGFACAVETPAVNPFYSGGLEPDQHLHGRVFGAPDLPLTMFR